MRKYLQENPVKNLYLQFYHDLKLWECKQMRQYFNISKKAFCKDAMG